MTYDPNKKDGSNRDRSTSPADVARLAEHIRRNAKKKRHGKNKKEQK